ncbi:MAG: hypothetical protein GEU99_06800 [Luteitalea sp.]|nr:hypothetical protein [Luteitalea sp.]
MFQDSRSVERDVKLTADVCVVGGGAAGITLATAFAKSGINTCVIEAGGMGIDVGTQALYRGRVTGGTLAHNYLVTSRLRQFGGTTNHWGGHTLPINAHVFGHRPGVPGGEWPFPKSELDPYYERAAVFLGAKKPYQIDASESADTSFLKVTNYPIEHLRVGQVYRETLEQAASVRVLLFGNVVEFETARDGGRLRAVRVATLGGNRFSVSARVFVLATGAIENARLLLQPSRTSPRGIGNEHDLVGRYFMEHLYLLPGLAVRTSGKWPRFTALAPGLQARHQLSDVGLHLRDPPQKPDELSRAMLSAARVLDGFARKPDLYRAVLYGEVLPNRNNRVQLATERDELGQLRCDLRFEISDVDWRNLQETQRVAAGIVGERGWGRLRLVETPSPFGIGNHHMGTTRMNPNPRLGVVDGWCRVHSLSNLFIAGSSVFPSTGLANPTFTLVALAYRLADHLIQGIQQRAFNST